MEVPGALSHMRMAVSEQNTRMQALAKSLRPEGTMGEFEVAAALW